MLVLVQKAAHAISTFTEVIRTMILLTWAVGLFFKPKVKSTSLAPHTHVRHHACIVQTPRGQHECSSMVEPTRWSQLSYVAPGWG